MTLLKDVVEILEKLFTIAAIIVGGAWTYYHFFRGRTFTKRLEPGVTAEYFDRNGSAFVRMTLRVKNVGLSSVRITQKGTGVMVSLETRAPKTQPITWETHGAFPVFESHGWIEPGESIEEAQLISLPQDATIAVRCELRIVSEGLEWNAMTIAVRAKDVLAHA